MTDLTDLNTQAPAQLVTKGYVVDFDNGAIDYCARRNATAECRPGIYLEQGDWVLGSGQGMTGS